jgi:hypothetical protein
VCLTGPADHCRSELCSQRYQTARNDVKDIPGPQMGTLVHGSTSSYEEDGVWNRNRTGETGGIVEMREEHGVPESGNGHQKNLGVVWAFVRADHATPPLSTKVGTKFR